MVFALLLAVSMMAGNILELYRTSVDAFLGTRSTQTVTEQSDDESDAWTYKSEFTTAKEAYEGFKDFAIETSQETFALLKNENGALPLAKDAKITMLGVRSYAPVYGNSGEMCIRDSTGAFHDCDTSEHPGPGTGANDSEPFATGAD